MNGLRVELRVSEYVNDMYVKKNGRCFPVANMQQVNLRYLAFMCYCEPLTTFLPEYLEYAKSSHKEC